MRHGFLAVGLSLLVGSTVRVSGAVFTEDFSGGNPVSSTDYTLVSAGTMTEPGDYRVVNNPANPNLNNNYGSVYDHTTGDASGEMLFFDGAPSSSSRIYYQSENLTGGVEYTFSYWQEADNMGSPPDLQAYVNGTTLLGDLQNSSSQTWAQFSANFTPGVSGSYEFSIRDANTVALYNDGAIDDVQLVQVPEPSVVALLSIIGMTAVTIRRRR
jgi:hypothetical protein